MKNNVNPIYEKRPIGRTMINNSPQHFVTFLNYNESIIEIL